MSLVTSSASDRGGRASALTLDDVLDTAARIADTEGLRSLSVRRLANELGVAPMTIYSHVSSKDSLLGLMARRIADRFELPLLAAQSWQDQVEAIMVELRAFLLRYPSLALLLTTRRVVSVGLTRSIEATLAHLTQAGFELEDAVSAYSALFAYVLGFVSFERPRIPGEAPDMADVAARLKEIGEAGRFPHVEMARDLLPAMASDDSFRLGLRSLIDGLPGAAVTRGTPR